MNSQRRLRSSLKLFLIAIVASFSFSACTSSGDGDVLYYVALGDSLSVGVQQDPTTGEDVETDEGYADQLYAALLPQFPNLQLVKLGCPGETTVTMVNGGLCDDYETGSQLGDALEFLVANQEQILLVTIDIGANDVLGSDCLELPDPAQVQACFAALFPQIGSNLSLISSGLFSASDGVFPVIGMTFYNPLLASWLTGPVGQAQAMATAALQEAFNTQVLKAVYGLNGFPVADVAASFQSNNFTDMVPFPPPFNMVPINVGLICQWTYMCPNPMSGLMPDIHANAAGYKTIADTFLAVFNSL